jgi:mono/diheme cytochrome c family protein
LHLAVVCVSLTILVLPDGLRAQKDVAKVFSANCKLCHAADGSGNSPSGKSLGAKDLRSAEIQNKTDQELTELIATGKGKMPAFGKKLQPDDIKQLVAYVRSLAKGK